MKKEYRLFDLEDGRTIVVPGWIHSNPGGDSFHFSYVHSDEQNGIVFMESHTTEGVEGDDWVPLSSCIPNNITPRPGFEDGIIRTLKEYFKVYWKDSKILGSIVDGKKLSNAFNSEQDITKPEFWVKGNNELTNAYSVVSREEVMEKELNHECESETECEIQLEEALIGKDRDHQMERSDEV